MAHLPRRAFPGRLLACAAALVGFAAVGCGDSGFDYGANGEGPGHRHQQVALSAAQEVKLGEEAFKEVLDKETADPDQEHQRTVKEVADKIFDQALHNEPLRREINISDRDPYGTPWDFSHPDYRVIEDPQVNAFCLPGAKVVVFTGLLDLTKAHDTKGHEDWLATVLGHEISHALAHHASERIAYEQMYGPASDATNGLTALGPDDRLKLLSLLGLGRHVTQPEYVGNRGEDSGQPGVFAQIRELSFDRQQEAEADHIGVFLMAFAGYDPEQAVAFWQAMEEKSGDKAPPEILSDHPSDQHRVALMRHWAVRAKDAEDAWKAGRVAPGP